MTKGLIPDDRDLLAAEYVLGLLGDTERANADALVQSEPAFALVAKHWQNRADDWLAKVEPIGPAPKVWERLAPLFGEDDVIPISSAALASPERSEQHQAIVKWRSRAYLAMAASLVLAFGLGLSLVAIDSPVPGAQDGNRPGGEMAVNRPATLNLAAAQIVGAQGEPLVTALFDPKSRELWLQAEAATDEEKALELWALDKTGKPFSLGIIDANNRKRRLTPALADVLLRDMIIAVSLEDRATAPHETPIGEVLGTAKFRIL